MICLSFGFLSSNRKGHFQYFQYPPLLSLSLKLLRSLWHVLAPSRENGRLNPFVPRAAWWLPLLCRYSKKMAPSRRDESLILKSFILSYSQQDCPTSTWQTFSIKLTPPATKAACSNPQNESNVVRQHATSSIFRYESNFNNSQIQSRRLIHLSRGPHRHLRHPEKQEKSQNNHTHHPTTRSKNLPNNIPKNILNPRNQSPLPHNRIHSRINFQHPARSSIYPKPFTAQYRRGRWRELGRFFGWGGKHVEVGENAHYA